MLRRGSASYSVKPVTTATSTLLTRLDCEWKWDSTSVVIHKCFFPMPSSNLAAWLVFFEFLVRSSREGRGGGGGTVVRIIGTERCRVFSQSSCPASPAGRLKKGTNPLGWGHCIRSVEETLTATFLSLRSLACECPQHWGFSHCILPSVSMGPEESMATPPPPPPLPTWPLTSRATKMTTGILRVPVRFTTAHCRTRLLRTVSLHTMSTSCVHSHRTAGIEENNRCCAGYFAGSRISSKATCLPPAAANGCRLTHQDCWLRGPPLNGLHIWADLRIRCS